MKQQNLQSSYVFLTKKKLFAIRVQIFELEIEQHDFKPSAPS